MPTFNRPRQAIIVEGGSGVSDLLGILAAVAVAALAIGGLVLFIAEHLLLISACLVALPAGTFAAVRFAHRWAMVVHDVPAKPALPLSVQASLLAPPRRAIAPVHNHVHFHGLSADDLAAAISQVVNVPPDAVRPSLNALPGNDRTQPRRAAR